MFWMIENDGSDSDSELLICDEDFLAYTVSLA